MARRFATRIGAIRVNPFARIDSQKNLIFTMFQRFVRIASNLRFANFSIPKRDSQKRVFFLSAFCAGDPQACVSTCTIVPLQPHLSSTISFWASFVVTNLLIRDLKLAPPASHS